MCANVCVSVYIYICIYTDISLMEWLDRFFICYRNGLYISIAII